jgi:transposase
MPKAYSADIRMRVIARVEGGASRREAAEQLDISPSAAVKWVKCYEVVSAMHKHGIAGSRTALWSFFKRHNISFKKKPARRGAGSPRRGPGT